MKRIASLLLAVVMLVSVLTIGASAASNFTDVNGHWSEAHIDYWTDKGSVSGYADSTFKPDNNITRAEVAQMLMNIFQLTGEGKGFTDVKSTDWYYAAVMAAQKLGIFEGYEDGSFRPNNKITRQECLVLIARITNTKENAEYANKFADAADISGWAKGAVGGLLEAGILSGYEVSGATYAYVLRSITRAEFLKLMHTTDVSTTVNWTVSGTTEDKTEDKEEQKPIISGGGGGGPIQTLTYYTCEVKLQDKADATKTVTMNVPDFILGTSPVLADVSAQVNAATAQFKSVFGDTAANTILNDMKTAYSNAVGGNTTAFNTYVDGVTVTKNGAADTTLQAAVKADVAASYATIGVGTWTIEYTVSGGNTYVVTLTIGIK